LANWLANDWKNIITNVFTLWLDYIGLIGTAIVDLGAAFARALSGEGFSFDFELTKTQFQRLKEQASKTLSGLEIPELDLSNAAPELRNQLAGVTDEIARLKAEARKNQDATREQMSQEKQTKKKEEDMKAGVDIRNKQQAQFSDPVSFWKKLQEAAAGQRIEEIQAKQLAQQEQMVKLLDQINRGISQGGAPKEAAGVFPR
jgi:uncharacterized small protein (DUF1192 family)